MIWISRKWRALTKWLGKRYDEVDDVAAEFFGDSVGRLLDYGPAALRIVMEAVQAAEATGQPGNEKFEFAVKAILRGFRGIGREFVKKEVHTLIQLAVLRLGK